MVSCGIRSLATYLIHVSPEVADVGVVYLLERAFLRVMRDDSSFAYQPSIRYRPYVDLPVIGLIEEIDDEDP